MYVPHERRALILRLLEQRGYLRSAELAAELGVTEETIRTDLIALHERRLLCRVHGGARYIPPTGSSEDAARLDCQLADCILRHLQPGMVLYADSSTTTQALFQRMAHLPCTILTPSLRLASSLSAKALPQQVIIPGGSLEKESGLISSEAAPAFFTRHRPDAALLFPPSVPSPESAAYHHAEKAAWAAAAAAAAKCTILTAPAQAFYNTRAAHSISCRPQWLIAEDNLPPSFASLRTELVPYLSPADLQQAGDELT